MRNISSANQIISGVIWNTWSPWQLLFSFVTHALSLFLMDLPIPAMKISNHPLGDYCKSLHEQTN